MAVLSLDKLKQMKPESPLVNAVLSWEALSHRTS